VSETFEYDTTVRSVRRALGILRSFRATDRALALGEIAHRAQLDKATARRLLRTLMAEHLIEQNGATKAYSLGLGVLELSAGLTPCEDLRQRAQHVLAAIADATGATAFLGVVHDDAALCIGRVDGDEVIRLRAWSVGGRMPLGAGAGPRVLLAHLPPEQRARLLRAPPPETAAPGMANPAELATRLDAIRARGWELAIDEGAEGIASLGVPVRDGAGHVIAAISISGLHCNILDDAGPRHLAVLQSHVQDLERRLADQRLAS
jgi:DNA-binding IclR family transcriptional regulator